MLKAGAETGLRSRCSSSIVRAWIWTSSAGDPLTDPPTPPFHASTASIRAVRRQCWRSTVASCGSFASGTTGASTRKAPARVAQPGTLALEDGRALLVYRDLVKAAGT
jgi:hypothetical protein